MVVSLPFVVQLSGKKTKIDRPQPRVSSLMLRLKANSPYAHHQSVASYKSFVLIIIILLTFAFLGYRLINLQINKNDF